MALKPDRQIDANELGYYMNAVANPGVIASISTASSGQNLDSTANVAVVAASSSGQAPLGVLLDEVVNLDLTRVPTNWHKSQANIGDKVSIMRRGWVVTDCLAGAPTAGQHAVLASSGCIEGVTDLNVHDHLLQPVIGHFVSGPDHLGFARVYIEL